MTHLLSTCACPGYNQSMTHGPSLVNAQMPRSCSNDSPFVNACMPRQLPTHVPPLVNAQMPRSCSNDSPVVNACMPRLQPTHVPPLVNAQMPRPCSNDSPFVNACMPTTNSCPTSCQSRPCSNDSPSSIIQCMDAQATHNPRPTSYQSMYTRCPARATPPK